jgi:TRAP-type C4-dicarboxylate transport system substrate-binding protein
MGEIMTTRSRKLTVAIAATLMLAACGGGASPSAVAPASVTPTATAAPTATPTAQAAVKLVLAHSYTDAQPQAACGATVIKNEAEAAGVGLTIEIFGNNTMGSDADRIQSVVSGDIDMDIQGASALSNLYAPMGAVDGAFVFDDSDHMYRFFTSARRTS